ncbi:MAG: hypothetical protein ACRDYC_01915 [Acidimicrobiales bacterium]
MRPKTEPVGDEGSAEEDAAEGPQETRPANPARRRLAFAIWRALVVLLVGAISYALVVPYSHVHRKLMGGLIISRPPLPHYTDKTTVTAPQVVSQSGISVMKSAGQHSPDKTGLYSRVWQVSDTDATGVIVGVLPTSAQARQAVNEVASSQLGANSFSSSMLTQSAQYVVPTIPGSHAALYVPSPGAAPGSLGVMVFPFQKVWVAVDLLYSKNGQANLDKVAAAELQHVKQSAPGFSWKDEAYPAIETSVWGGVTVLIAALVGFGPAALQTIGRRREEKRQRELASRVVVKGKTIQKRRRS